MKIVPRKFMILYVGVSAAASMALSTPAHSAEIGIGSTSLRPMQVNAAEVPVMRAQLPRDESLNKLANDLREWQKSVSGAEEWNSWLDDLTDLSKIKSLSKVLKLGEPGLKEKFQQYEYNIAVRKARAHLDGMVAAGQLASRKDIEAVKKALFGPTGQLREVSPKTQAYVADYLEKLRDTKPPESKKPAKDPSPKALHALQLVLVETNIYESEKSTTYKQLADDARQLSQGLGELANVLGPEFPELGKQLTVLANGAELVARIAASNISPLAIPGAFAQSIVFAKSLFGAKRQPSETEQATALILQAMLQLSKATEQYHYEEMAKLGEIAYRLAELTRTYQSNELQSFEVCGTLLGKDYLSRGIPQVWVSPPLFAGFDRKNLYAASRRSCYETLIKYFPTTGTPPALFEASLSAGGAEEGSAMRRYIPETYEPTLEATKTVLTKKAIATYVVSAASGTKVDIKSPRNVAPFDERLTDEVFVRPLDPWLVSRAAGYAVALYWTLEIYGQDGKSLPAAKWGENAGTARAILDSAAGLVRRAAIQQRMLLGTAALPAIRALMMDNLEELTKLRQDGVLNEGIPVEHVRQDQKEQYEEIKKTALCAVGSNPVLASNLLLFDLRRTMPGEFSQTRLKTAMSSRGGADLFPIQWRRDWRIFYGKGDAASEDQWMARMSVYSRVADKKTGKLDCQPTEIQIPLPPTEAIISGALQRPPMLWHLDAVYFAAKREQSAVALGFGEVPGVHSRVLHEAVRAGIDPAVIGMN